MQGCERDAYLTLARLTAKYPRIAYGARAPGRRSRRSSPGPGKPATWRRAAGMQMARAEEVREMRSAETVLAIIHDRGKRGLPLEDVYRQLYNPDLYLQAYGKISRNAGAMTRGSTPETVDGMSEEKIAGLIALLREEKYRWTPVRRVYIEKQGSTKKRPLGIPTWSDKLLQEVIRMVLAAYYEPQFSDHSHGFRPARGCHTALREVYRTWTGTTWFVEGDIKGCFEHPSCYSVPVPTWASVGGISARTRSSVAGSSGKR